MPKLYEISEEIERFMIDVVDKETGEIDEESLMSLAALEGEIKEKCLAVAAYMKGVLLEADATEAHATEMMKVANDHIERGAVFRRQADSLKRYLQRYAPHENFEDSRSKLTWRKSTKVEFQDGKELKDVPVKYRIKKTTWSLDKTNAKAFMATGKKIKGLLLNQYDNLTVK